MDGEFAGDITFPPNDPAAWQETFRQTHPADTGHPHSFTWLILERLAD